jgi:hypothetical protein
MAILAAKPSPGLRRSAPHWWDLTPVIVLGLSLALLTGILVWTLARGQASILGAVGGVVVGVLLAVGWSLRDGMLQGEPRIVRAQRISRFTLAFAFALGAALWLPGLGSGPTAILIAGIVFVAWITFTVAATAMVNRETESVIVTVGAGGAGRALAVYHSAHGGLMRALQEAFASAMAAQGWQVDLVTASRAALTDLSGYQLLVLGAPCYNRRPPRPILTYLDRLPDLRNLPVVIVVSGFNRTDGAMRILDQRVRQAHGNVLDEIEIWTARPNVPRDGTSDPMEIMRRAGARAASRIDTAAA